MSSEVPTYTQRDVTALLDSQGRRLYWYFWLMLGDRASVTRALAATVIVALPYRGQRKLFGVARTVRRQYLPVPAVPYARAEAPTLAAATKAALRRLEPEDREICALGAPAYQLDDADLAAVFGTGTGHDLRSRAMALFARKLEACAANARLEHSDDLAARALQLAGTGQFALPYDQVVPLAVDPAAEWIRKEIRSRVAVPILDAPVRQEGLELLGSGSRPSVTIRGVRERDRVTVPLLRMLGGGQPGSGRRRAVAGTVLAAGVIPVAIAVAWAAAHSAQPSQHSASSPLAAAPAAPAAPALHAGSSRTGRQATRPVRPPVRRSGTRPGVPPAATSPQMSQGMAVSAQPVAALRVPPYVTAAKTSAPTSAPRPVSAAPLPSAPPPSVSNNGNGHGKGNGNGNSNANGNGNGNGNGVGNGKP